jgi:hypothetical protein
MRQMLRFAESLVYEKDDATFQKVEQMAAQYVAGLKQLSADALKPKKDEVKRLRDVFRYLARFKIVPTDFAPKNQIEEIIKEQNWDKK